MQSFTQAPPQLTNAYLQDGTLRSVLRRLMPVEVYTDLQEELSAFGARVVRDIGRDADLSERYPPKLVHVRPWGQRVDEIQVHESWRRLHKAAAEEGLIAIGYERAHGQYSRLHQYCKVYLFSAVSIVSCPLAMTDGAARLVELTGDAALKKRALARIVSRDPEVFATSGQWMTERTGGSDVSETSTLARLASEEELAGDSFRQMRAHFGGESSRVYALNGYKFFTSATTSAMAFALGRVVEEDGSTKAGSRGLSLFYVDVQDENTPSTDEAYHLTSFPHNCNRKHRSIEVVRLKDKLGTKGVPTAELELHDTPALLVGKKGEGVRTIATMFNITRIHNALSSCSLLQRAHLLAQDFTLKRTAFGKRLDLHPLHMATLARFKAEVAACVQLVFHCALVLGRVESGEGSKQDGHLLRILFPLIKLYTAKAAVRGVSEMLEMMGGTGYMEDSGVPRLLRDAQVLPIWEGTTNVLSMDVLRVLARHPAAFDGLIDFVAGNLRGADAVPGEQVRHCVTFLEECLARARALLQAVAAGPRPSVEAVARELSMGLAQMAAASLMVEHLGWMHRSAEPAADVAAYANLLDLYCKHFVVPVPEQLPSEASLKANYASVFTSKL